MRICHTARTGQAEAAECFTDLERLCVLGALVWVRSEKVWVDPPDHSPHEALVLGLHGW
jgi:hypothetical protein